LESNLDAGCGAVGAGATVTQTRHLPSLVGDATSGPNITQIANSAWLEASRSGNPLASLLGDSTTTPAAITVTWNCNTATSKAWTTAKATSTDPMAAGSASIKVTVSYVFTPITPIVSNLFPNLTMSTTVYGQAEY
jgi:hypothetical protein